MPLTKRRLANLNDPNTGIGGTSVIYDLAEGASSWTDGRPVSPVSPVIDLSAYDCFFSSDLPVTNEDPPQHIDLTTTADNSALRHEPASPNRIEVLKIAIPDNHITPHHSATSRQLVLTSNNNPISHNTATPTCTSTIDRTAISRQSYLVPQQFPLRYSDTTRQYMNTHSHSTASPTCTPTIDRTATTRQSNLVPQQPPRHYTATTRQSTMKPSSDTANPTCPPTSQPNPSTHNANITSSQSIRPPPPIHPFFMSNTHKRKRITNTPAFIPDKRRTNPDAAGETPDSRTHGRPAPPDLHATVIPLHAPLVLSDISDIPPTHEGQTTVIYDPLSISSALTATRQMPAPPTKLSHDKRLDIS